MKLKLVTVTGADDSIDPIEILNIAAEYPFVEFGILLSKNSMGKSRFPSLQWMKELNQLSGKFIDINFSGHLCGGWMRNLMATGDISFISEIPLWDQFKRVQLNFHAEKTEMSTEAFESLRNQTWKHKKHFIVQMDNVNNKLYERMLFGGISAEPLFDVSHGAGIVPNEWPEVIPSVNPHAFRGYAGGLSPTNLADELEKIDKIVGEDQIWIDMETKIRSDNDKLFDLDKVKKCLEITKRYI